MRRSAPSSHRYGYLARTHTHAHTSYILAGPVPSACVCVIVHVSEVGQQQQRYLTHPEKTSGQFKQPSHWLQLPVCAHKTINNTHVAICSCCIRTSAGMHTHIHTHTHLGQIPAAQEQKFQHTHHIHRLYSECSRHCLKFKMFIFCKFLMIQYYCTQYLTLSY